MIRANFQHIIELYYTVMIYKIKKILFLSLSLSLYFSLSFCISLSHTLNNDLKIKYIVIL